VDLSAGLAISTALRERLRRTMVRWTAISSALRERAKAMGKELTGSDFVEAVYEEEVPDGHVGLMVVDGRLLETLQPGVHAFWNFARNLQIELTDLRLQELEVQGQQILTRDKVSLRINLNAHYRVTDAAGLRAQLPRPKDWLYRELQFGLRQAVSGRTLDELLAEKGALEQEMHQRIAELTKAQGLQVESLGIKDIILPGDMKEIMNQVVQAEKAAQANLIRRREETAATRSLLNTAKLMEQNPLLLRLKELEALERVTERVGSLTLFGGLESVLQNLVRIKAD
jgi:regulator of protease activity HflC (stomatin/prohibitin superfamily)